LEILEEDLMDDLEIQNLQNQENAQNMEWRQEGNVIINNIHLGMVRIEDSFFQPSPNNRQLSHIPAPRVDPPSFPA
jgi:hypothetical protein